MPKRLSGPERANRDNEQAVILQQILMYLSSDPDKYEIAAKCFFDEHFQKALTKRGLLMGSHQYHKIKLQTIDECQKEFDAIIPFIKEENREAYRSCFEEAIESIRCTPNRIVAEDFGLFIDQLLFALQTSMPEVCEKAVEDNYLAEKANRLMASFAQEVGKATSRIQNSIRLIYQ